MRLAPLSFVRRHARLLFATLAVVAIAASTMFAQFGTFDPAFDGELWGVRHELTPANGTPAGVAFFNGTLYVADQTNQTVLAYDANGNLVPTANHDWDSATIGSPILGLIPNQLLATTIDVNGTPRNALLLTDQKSNRVAAFDVTGAYLFTLRLQRPTNAPLYSLATGQVALSPGAKFTFTSATHTLSLSGSFTAAWFEQIATGSVDTGAMVFQGPIALPFSGGEFAATPTIIKRGNEHDPVEPSPAMVFGVVYDPLGNLYVMDAFTERLHVYGPALNHLFDFGTPAADGTSTEFHEPWGLAFWPDAVGTGGRVFINDTYKSRIMVYRPFDGTDAGTEYDGMQLETIIKDFVPAHPAISLFSIALDPAAGKIAVTDYADDDGAHPRAVVLQQPNLATYNFEELDGQTGGAVQSVCTGASYQIRFSLTVPQGRAAVTNVVPQLLIDGVLSNVTPTPGGTYPSPMTLAAGDVATFTYALTAPATVADLAILAGATASTTDILQRAEIISLADCASETDPSTVTATPNIPPQVTGWTPVLVGDTYAVTLQAQDDDGIASVEYKLDGANETGDEAIATDFDGAQTDASVIVPIPEFGRTALLYRMRDGNGIWSPWLTLNVRPKLVIDRLTNENVDVQFRVGDPEGIGYLYSVTGLPDGVNFSTATGQFGGVVSFDASNPYSADPSVASGIYHVTVTEAAPGGATSSVSFTWTVNNINRHPTITPILPTDIPAIVEGQPFELVVHGHDPDGDKAFFTFHGRSVPLGYELPPSVTIDPATGKISGTFPLDSEPSYVITVGLSECGGTADDNPIVCAGVQPRLGLATLYEITVPVTNVNQPPAVSNPGPQSNAQGQTITPLQIVASDPDVAVGDVLNFSAGSLPPGLSISAATGLITGTVNANAPAMVYPVVVVVRDSIAAVPLPSVQFNWTITDSNHAPTVSSPDRSSIENETVNVTILHGDVDGDALTFTMTGLPPTHTINNLGAISGTFNYDSAGDYVVTVTVSDGSKTASTTFNWKVYNVNRYPVLNVADQISAEGQTVTLPIDGTDPDHDPLTFTMNGLPPSFAINSSTGVINGTFDYNSAGVYTINVGLVDGQLGVVKTFKWTVTETNRPPTVTPIPNRLNAENDTVSLHVTAVDPDGDAPLTYSAANLPPGLSINAATGDITGTLTYAAAGVYTVSITVNDGKPLNNKTTVNFQWTVTNVNRRPTVTAPDRVNAENDTVAYATTASDPDGDALTYSATGLPAGITINPTTGVIGGTLGYTTAGTYNVTITVTDGSLSASAPFVWTVTNTNAPPVITNPGNLVNNEGEAISRQIVATDVDGNNTLTFSAVGLPPGLSMSATGLVTGSLSYTSAGVYSVIVTVSDGMTSRTAPFTWTVNNVNRPPDVINPGTQTSAENSSPTLPIIASDPDGQILTYSATGLPPGLLINPVTGVISGSLSFTASGTYSVIVKAVDGTGAGALSDSETFTWIVANVNRPPTAVDDLAAATQDEAKIIDVRVNDTDPDGTTLTITAVTAPTNGTVVISAGGTTVTYTPTSTFIGTATFTYTVSDGTATSTAKVTITVLSSNKPPVCSAATGGEIWPPNHKKFYVASINGVTDPENNPVTIKVTSIWQDELLDSTGDGQFSPDGRIDNGVAWIRAERNGHQNTAVGDGRVYEILFTATDSKGASCKGSVFWTVPHDQGQGALAIDSGVRYDSTGVIPGTRDKSQIHQLSQQ